MACSFLFKNGFNKVISVIGGMNKIQELTKDRIIT